jgi:hypothetical protein
MNNKTKKKKRSLVLEGQTARLIYKHQNIADPQKLESL